MRKDAQKQAIRIGAIRKSTCSCWDEELELASVSDLLYAAAEEIEITDEDEDEAEDIEILAEENLESLV